MRALTAYAAALGRVIDAYRARSAGTVAAIVLTGIVGIAGVPGLGGTTGSPTPSPPTPAPGPAVPAPTPPSAPADPGDDDYAFLFDHGGQPMGFDPCSPTVHVLYNPVGSPYEAEADVAASVGLLAQGLGRPVRFDGPTDLDPDDFIDLAFGDDPPAEPTVLIGWVATPEDIDATSSDVVGQTQPVEDGDSIVAASIQLVASTGRDLGPGTGPDSWSVVMIHELGHAAGLDHVDDDTEIMYPAVVSGRSAQWGAGDLNGLRRLAGSCWAGAAPGPTALRAARVASRSSAIGRHELPGWPASNNLPAAYLAVAEIAPDNGANRFAVHEAGPVRYPSDPAQPEVLLIAPTRRTPHGRTHRTRAARHQRRVQVRRGRALLPGPQAARARHRCRRPQRQGDRDPRSPPGRGPAGAIALQPHGPLRRSLPRAADPAIHAYDAVCEALYD